MPREPTTWAGRRTLTPRDRRQRAVPRRRTGRPSDCDDARPGRACAPRRPAPDDFVWVGLHEPDERRARRRSPSALRPAPAGRRGRRSTPTSAPRSSGTTTRCSSSSRRSGTSTRRTPSRPARSTCSSATTSSSPCATAQGGELHDARRDLEAASQRARARPVGGRLRRVRPGRRRLRGGGRRRSRRTSTRSRSRCSPTQRTNDSARIYILKRELAEMRRAVMPLREPMSRFATGAVPRHPRGRRAVLPRRRRPPQPGRRDHRRPRRAAVHRLRRPPRPDLGPAERGHAEDLGRGRPRRRADADRRHLRHELRPHARAALALRLPDGPRR